MPFGPIDEAKMFRTFNAHGEEWVRARLPKFNAEWRPAAERWLGKKGLEKERLSAANRAEEVEVAKAGVQAAKDNARATWFAAVVSVGAAVVSMIAAVASWLSSHGH